MFDKRLNEAKCQCPSGRIYWEEDGRCYEPYAPGTPRVILSCINRVGLQVLIFMFVQLQGLARRVASYTRAKKCRREVLSGPIRTVGRCIKCRSVGRILERFSSFCLPLCPRADDTVSKEQNQMRADYPAPGTRCVKLGRPCRYFTKRCSHYTHHGLQHCAFVKKTRSENDRNFSTASR